MNLNLSLRKEDYTIYNALGWGNCLNHARLSCRSTRSCSERAFHGVVAFVEAIPVMSQIASLMEMAIAMYLKPSLADLTKKEIKPVEPQEHEFPHRVKTITAPSLSSDVISVVLPQKVESLDTAIFHLHRQIERAYQQLPWPPRMKKVVVLTQILGGRGDIAAAAKVICLLQRLSPAFTFDWILDGPENRYDPRSFLNCEDHSKINIRYRDSLPTEDVPGDLLLTGPCRLIWSRNYIEKKIHRKIEGPIFNFMENAEILEICNSYFFKQKVRESLEKPTTHEIYRNLHPTIFPSESDGTNAILPMGIEPGTGVFLDQSRIDADLSRGYCCPSYLLNIQNEGLKQDILESMNVFNNSSVPNYDQHSFNSGYAHHLVSWGKFIDCVAMHEKNKHVVIVLNQVGEFVDTTTQEFQDQIFTRERLNFLREKGYGTVICKGAESEVTLLQKARNPQIERRLIVLIRPSFHPNDMKMMQLASERLLATGDNSAVESLCSRCILYLYEDVANMGCKWRFLQQQVDVAKKISPNLSRLLALFGGDSRLQTPGLNQPFNQERLSEVERLLNDPKLSESTLQFCDFITSTYSFDGVVEAALKRAAWHYSIKDLVLLESETLDEEFRLGLINYLQNVDLSEKFFCVRKVPEIAFRVKEVVDQHIL